MNVSVEDTYGLPILDEELAEIKSGDQKLKWK